MTKIEENAETRLQAGDDAEATKSLIAREKSVLALRVTLPVGMTLGAAALSRFYHLDSVWGFNMAGCASLLFAALHAGFQIEVSPKNRARKFKNAAFAVAMAFPVGSYLGAVKYYGIENLKQINHVWEARENFRAAFRQAKAFCLKEEGNEFAVQMRVPPSVPAAGLCFTGAYVRAVSFEGKQAVLGKMDKMDVTWSSTLPAGASRIEEDRSLPEDPVAAAAKRKLFQTAARAAQQKCQAEKGVFFRDTMQDKNRLPFGGWCLKQRDLERVQFVRECPQNVMGYALKPFSDEKQIL